MDPAKVERILRNSATDDAHCIGTPERNSIYGDGIVNAPQAVALTAEMREPNSWIDKVLATSDDDLSDLFR